VAVVCVSLGSILVRLAQAPPLAVSFYRVFLASLFLAPFAVATAARSWPGLPPRQRWLLVGCGISLALHFATWITSLSYTSVAVSVLLVNTAPLFTVLFARVFLHETPSGLVLAATGLALVGAALIAAGDWSGSGLGSLTGVALALAGAVTMSIYHVIGRGLRDALPLNAYVLGVWATAAATLGLMNLVARVPLVSLPPRTFAVLAALALVPTLAGHGLVNRSLRELPAPVVGLFLLGEPIGASVLAYGLFAEVPGGWTIAGGVIVLLALALVVLGGAR
jgi:drug/metabolite transporter (DMT)-like permease